MLYDRSMPDAPPGNSRTVRWIATVFGLGDLLPAPGTTAGSFPATLLWLAVCWAVTAPPHRMMITAAGALVFTLVAVWACGVEASQRGKTDPGPVVIDEVAGQLLSFGVALPFVSLAGGRELIVFAIAGFFAFRFFDIVKPWPARQLEALGGGLGIVADDLAAGVQAAIVLVVGFQLLGN
jgi:phosphatidylglycerophosphatase A